MRLQDTVVVVTRAARALAGWLRSEYGRVDALVNNASVAARDRLPPSISRPGGAPSTST